MKQITVVHCSETLVVSGCCRVMEHLARGADPARFQSMFCAQAGDASYLDYLRTQKILPLLLSENGEARLKEIGASGDWVAVLHRSGDNAPFWNRLIPLLKRSGAKAIIERNIFGYADAAHDSEVDLLCANSLNTLWHHWRQSGKPQLGEYLKRRRVLYNALSFAPPEEKMAELRVAWRKKLNIPADAFAVGIVTRPDARKIDALMAALAPWLKKQIPGFTLVTRCYPEMLAVRLKRILGENYHNLPLSADPEALMATYAIVDACGNFPSIGESFGMAIAEAMRARRPVVALDMPQPDKGNAQRELIVDGETGFLAENPIGVAQGFYALATDLALRQKMGEAGYRRMTTAPFSLQSVIAQFESEVARLSGDEANAPLQPTLQEIQHYLENYPARQPAAAARCDPLLALKVGVERFWWRLQRRVAA